MRYIVLSIILLILGLVGLLTKRSLLKFLISIEIIAMAVTMNFVLLPSTAGKAFGEALLILAFSTEICLSTLILLLFTVIVKKYKKWDLREVSISRNRNGS